MPKTELTAESAVSLMRTMKVCFIVSCFLFVLAAYRVPSQGASAADTTVEFAISAVALMNVALGFLLPRFLMRQAVRAPRSNPHLTLVQRWMSFTVIGLAFFESCSLFAFSLHMLGARAAVVGVLFAVGICSMIVWDFGRPPADLPPQ